MNKIAHTRFAARAALASLLLASGTAAMAELPAGAEAAITSAGADVVAAIGLVILAGIGIYAAKLVGRKMGWL